jgi:hypothetical protein
VELQLSKAVFTFGFASILSSGLFAGGYKNAVGYDRDFSSIGDPSSKTKALSQAYNNMRCYGGKEPIAVERICEWDDKYKSIGEEGWRCTILYKCY